MFLKNKYINKILYEKLRNLTLCIMKNKFSVYFLSETNFSPFNMFFKFIFKELFQVVFNLNIVPLILKKPIKYRCILKIIIFCFFLFHERNFILNSKYRLLFVLVVSNLIKIVFCEYNEIYLH